MHFTLPLAALMYVLTGGPAVGKTSIINELEKQGEVTVPEAATDWIASRLEAGIAEFWKEEDINYNIVQLQLEREKPLITKPGRVFIDRGIFDTFTYMAQFSLAGSRELAKINQAVNAFDLNKHYAAVFLILPYREDFAPIKDEIRIEDERAFYEIQASLYTTYCRHKHFIPVPGNLSPKERAGYILDAIERIENGSH